MHTTIFFLSMARHALRAATGDPFPEREEVVGILTRVGEIAETHIARASSSPSMPAANDRALEHVCPFAACADTGLLANGELCGAPHNSPYAESGIMRSRLTALCGSGANTIRADPGGSA
jgi:hypothetical protein